MKTRYDVGSFSASCDEMVRKFVKNKHYYHVIEKSHYEYIIEYSNNLKMKRVSFIMNDWVFDVMNDETSIFSLDNHFLILFPKELQPETVDIEKVKTLLLFS